MTEKLTMTLFTRENCHLCVKAEKIIEQLQGNYDFIYEKYDIEEKEEWMEKYSLMIPVVMVNGKEVQFGQIDSSTLIQALIS